MPNGRALPTALLFDELLARAWERAQRNVNAATTLAAPVVDASMLAKGAGEYDIPPFEPRVVAFSARDILLDYDIGVANQLRALQTAWESEMRQVINTVAPLGAVYDQALAWLARSAGGDDALGYLGQEHRAAQLQGMQAQVLQSAGNPRGLPQPAGAAAALLAVGAHLTGIALGRADAQMSADRERERMGLQVEAAELLMRLRNAAVDAAIDYVNNRMTVMLEVYGSNNDFRTEVEMGAATKRATMQAAVSALDLHEVGIKNTHAAFMDQSRRVGEINDRAMERTMMLVDSYVKRMRRHATRATSALNSAGVSVNSTASESNTVSADQ